MASFTAIKLENWRNFTRVDVELKRRALLVGPNASGKSNFLDVFRFLHDLVAVGGGFQEAVRKRGGVSSIRSLAARRYPAITIQVGIQDDNDTTWAYDLRFTQDNRRRPVITREAVHRGDGVVLERPDERDRTDSERLTQTYVEQVHANQEFRAIAEFFSSVNYLHIVPHLVRDPDRSSIRIDDSFGADFLERVAKTNAKTRDARLRRIQEVLVVAVPQMRQMELYRDDRGVPHLRGKYEHWRPQGAWQSEDQFSDGTLRLLGLLWAVQDGSGPLLLEEPELSLHPLVVRHIPRMLYRVQRRSGRQIIISTHSSEMLLDEGIGLNEVFLFQPGKEGTIVSPATEIQEISALLEGGVPLGDVVLPMTGPANSARVAQLGE